MRTGARERKQSGEDSGPEVGHAGTEERPGCSWVSFSVHILHVPRGCKGRPVRRGSGVALRPRPLSRARCVRAPTARMAYHRRAMSYQL